MKKLKQALENNQHKTLINLIFMVRGINLSDQLIMQDRIKYFLCVRNVYL